MERIRKTPRNPRRLLEPVPDPPAKKKPAKKASGKAKRPKDGES